MVLSNNQSLINLYNTDYSVGLEVHSLVVISLAIIAAIVIFYVIYQKRFSVDSIDLNFDAKLLKCSYHLERNYQNLEIAHRIYTELITRKAAIPIEPDNDVIKEIYDSWYALFKSTREEIKKLSGKSLRSEHCGNLVSMSVDILNKGLRPHLTTHQAKFRKWYSEELDKAENKGKSPQEIQKKYPEYDELIESMKKVNELLIEYAENLKTFLDTSKN